MSDSGHTRRRVLGATGGLAGLVTLGGCGLFDDEPEPPPAPDALQPVLDEALALAGSYERLAVTQPRLAPFGQAHRAHATALADVIGTTLPAGSAAPSAAATADTVAALRKAELAAQKTAVAACKAAPAARAALLGSIAAARATHAEALR
ncbi:hypothetical protein ACTOB_007504 [Actinoplanes oblitus]|uniref:DUF4439 domain-containing protein n=1 Tax=Actinoplanes oblitus TaxID=3040509 RepID=A0ABY8WDE4_9ACTN|nr:hypothetical protein [Actinoplanes oblitus]WIM95402.1 hypothetical protein ACTOB_007504 [Actinoplanes oblitus]